MSKFSFEWLTERLAADQELPFSHFSYFNSNFFNSDDSSTEAVLSLVENFFRILKGDFKIITATVDIIGLKRSTIVNELFPVLKQDDTVNSTEQSNPGQILAPFKNFLLLQPKSRNSPFMKKLAERGLRFHEIERSTRLSTGPTYPISIVGAKNFNLVIQLLLDFILGNMMPFELMSSFPFLFSMRRRIECEVKSIAKESYIPQEDKILSERMTKSLLIRSWKI